MYHVQTVPNVAQYAIVLYLTTLSFREFWSGLKIPSSSSRKLSHIPVFDPNIKDIFFLKKKANHNEF